MFRSYGWLLTIFCLYEFRLTLIFIVIVLSIQSAGASDIHELIVTEDAGIYYITVSAVIATSDKHVRQVITDYVHAYRINNSIIKSEVLPSPIEGNIRVKAIVLCCTPLFCREAERVDEVSTLASGDIRAVIVPDESDFSSGEAIWKITPDGNKTYLVYRASIEPDFFIPPIIGTRMVIDNLRKQFMNIFFRIEQVALIKEEREWSDNFGVSTVSTQINVNLQ